VGEGIVNQAEKVQSDPNYDDSYYIPLLLLYKERQAQGASRN
jgi:hypothetical protein